ncbi:hypothetical protein [Roseateles noduli]|jgi:hypothetical protein|uniref:hypothetical protein n=1 Tax=Roseateles noduli TaxID=2052484 RepID=UPI003D658FA5
MSIVRQGVDAPAITKMLRFLVLLAIVSIWASTAWPQTAPPPAVDRLETLAECGDAVIETITFCTRSSVPGEGSCFGQQVSLRNKSGSYIFLLANPNSWTDRSLARGGQCIASGREHLVAISSSNLGSGATCDECERNDVFALSPAPHYIGSVGALPSLIFAAPDPLKPLDDASALRAYRDRMARPGAPIYDFDLKWFIR